MRLNHKWLSFVFLFACSLLCIDQQEPNATPSLDDLIFEAIAEGDAYAVRYYVDQGADVNAQFGDHGDTPLLLAIKCLHVLKTYYDQKFFSDPYTFNIAYANRLAIIRFLIFNKDVDCYAKNYNGDTALTLATQEGLDHVVELLVNRIQLNSLQSSVDDTNDYKDQLDELDIPDATYQKIKEAIEKSAYANSHEIGKHIEYLKFIFSLPWDKRSEEVQTLPEVAHELEADHYGLKKVKDKILEYIATSLLTPNKKTKKILCLVGPPGTGKTSIAQSIAKGLNRNFAKISLGGVHQESTIRGHSKTYVGAEPGDILKALKNAGTKNALILMDEIDKLGTENGWSGDPSAALLEVLDPEQNSHFTDHYLDIEFDLSEVFFITTANNASQIPRPLLDRMEMVKLSSYTHEEKFNIAKKHLAPKVLSETGLDEKGFTFSDETLNAIIAHYTYESGVRKLEQVLRTLCGKAARSLLETEKLPLFTPENLVEYLGAGYDNILEKEFTKQNNIGVSNGLFWTSVEGGVLFIETSIMPGKGKLKLTGNQKNTLQESANLAVSYVRAHAHELGINTIDFSATDIHIHMVPSSGMDGPSAGTAILSSIVSALTKKPFNTSYAMTGELSLTGRVLPIGGLKEKLLAAKKNGIKKALVPQGNSQDLVEIKDIITDMEITTVSYAHEVLEKVLLK